LCKKNFQFSDVPFPKISFSDVKEFPRKQCVVQTY
jgi:hypothetical protein